MWEYKAMMMMMTILHSGPGLSGGAWARIAYLWYLFAKCTAHGALHTLHCTHITAHSALDTAHFALCTAYCIFFTVHYTLHATYLHCVLHTAYCTLNTAFSRLHTLHCAVCMLQSTHYAWESSQTLHTDIALCKLVWHSAAVGAAVGGVGAAEPDP